MLSDTKKLKLCLYIINQNNMKENKNKVKKWLLIIIIIFKYLAAFLRKKNLIFLKKLSFFHKMCLDNFHWFKYQIIKGQERLRVKQMPGISLRSSSMLLAVYRQRSVSWMYQPEPEWKVTSSTRCCPLSGKAMLLSLRLMRLLCFSRSGPRPLPDTALHRRVRIQQQ